MFLPLLKLFYFMCDVLRVLEVLLGLAEGREELDTERMSSIIKRKIKNVMNQVF